MITIDNLKKVLEELHYERKKEKDIYEKKYNSFDCIIKVDFVNKLISYPEDKGMVIHRKTTCNFSEPENFVVLECITSLLDKGYKPNHIELEKPMPGGHDDTGGYCDILIKDNDNKTFLLIECKKSDEFDKYWGRTLADGGQLFRYYNSYRQAKALCLYTSDINESGIKRITNIISMEDNEKYLSTDKSLKSFKQVQEDNGDKIDYFNVWKTTYQQDYATRGIFEDDIDVYTVGKKKYTVDDLEEVDNDSIQKKYHEFATILRQHNVGSHENAFDKLVNLFLAKIVDETINPTELQFYWKGAAIDDYYSLQDRLQKLYKEGMEKYLNEEVTYVDQGEVSEAFQLFKNDPDATKEKVLEYFRKLKFYSNNDFSFLDVHNEDLFFKNAEILKKIVKMLEDIKLKTEEQNQFLGDLFEGFLDDGVKQSEGQFFTPLPIVKFLVTSLPLETIIRDNAEIPKVIDYACGAGHFLTEYASNIKSFVGKYKCIPLTEYYKEIYGIEKEYRLSKVSKVSAFMYGQDDINIIYGDALANNESVKDGKYAVLIANPPYSVKGFLEMLTEEERNKYNLINHVSDISKNRNIEAFFVERAQQLLMDGGVAAIILPSSVLSNGSLFIPCREIILKYFDIIAIAVLGAGTFGKTGTETSTLFLRRKESNPDLAEHYKNRVDSWFSNDNSKDVVFDDEDIIDVYCEHCKIDVSDYRAWLQGGEFPHNELFDAYIKKGVDSQKYKKISKRKITKRFSEDDKNKALKEYLSSFIKNIEKEKLYFFMLAFSNPCSVVVVNSPADTSKKQMKKFLGYEWSDSKGREGIKYLGQKILEDDEDTLISTNKGISSIETPLFDPTNNENNHKINYIIRNNFIGNAVEISEDLGDFVARYELVDMIDFSRAEFDKAIRTSGIMINNIEINSPYEVKSLDKIAKISRGASPRPIESYLTEAEDGINWIKIGDVGVGEKYIRQTAQRITPLGAEKSKRVYPGDLIISNSMSVGRPYILDIEGCVHDGWLLLSEISPDVKKEYLYYILTSEIGQLQFLGNARGGVVKNMNITRVSSVKIPIPPELIQDELVSNCNEIEVEITNLLKRNAELVEEKEKVLDDLFNKASEEFRLSNDDIFELNIGNRILDSEMDEKYKIPVYSANVYDPFGYIDKVYGMDYSTETVVWGIDGNWQVNTFPEGYVFYPTDHCGYMKINSLELIPKYVAYALFKEGQKRGFKRSLRASIDRVSSIIIKAPNVKIQKEGIEITNRIEEEISENDAKLRLLYDKKREIIEKAILKND